MTATEGNNNSKDGSKKGLFIGFILILLGINGYQFYLSNQDKSTIKAKEETIDVKTTENTKLVASLDSLQAIAVQQKSDYDALGVKNTDLEALIAKLEKQKRALQSSAGVYQKKYQDVQKELDNFKSELSENSGEIEKIKAQSDVILAEKNQLLEQRTKLFDSIAQLSVKTTALEQKVKIASKLMAFNVKTTVITSKSKELDEPIYKAKNIDKLNIKFSYADNKVSEVGGRVIYLRLIEPDGNTMQDANTSGSFNFEGQDITYTAKQDHLFDNSQKSIAFLTSKPGGGYKPGKYLVEIYTDGDKSGEGFFMVK